jgi:multidrug efflux system membrane fusion protein
MSRSRILGWTSLVAVIALAGGYALWQHGAGKHNGADHTRAATARAIPVKIATVRKSDFAVYLTGLGTVQGFNTVVVRTRVDGQIERIAFKEGQLVQKGDLLAHIDPRPFQAALDQAKAKKAQDEANRANANLDLQR